MNAARRKRIEAIRDQISAIVEGIEEIHAEEQEAFDNLPESLQAGPGGDAMAAAIDALGTAADEVGSVAGTLEEAAS